ncbi:tetratricopeptide repeat protein [Anaeromyxobacter oryzisoli]|uniref:tetratricopeptide repeat protein n=1 Tax=Anaeromyxobacter oryzisoli TaxID=2925408 RepID=UPI001F56547C|nr:tetratricopeptide repeat protein [Anaeromyxobacter sp. SG63]
MRAILAALAALVPAAGLAAAPATGYQSCRSRVAGAPGPTYRRAAPVQAIPPVSAEQAQDELAEAVKRFGEEAKGYREEVHHIVQKEFDDKRRFLADHYEQAIQDFEVLERNEREAAIARFEEFLVRYPDDAKYTPDAMFRLAELYYEKANDDYEVALAAHAEEARRALAEGRDPPPEPMKSYAPSIALYQRLITGFPGYRFTHGIYYLLAYCLGEMGQGEESQAAYAALIQRFPKSPFVAEAWVRLGDWHFDEVKPDSLQRAAEAFSKMYAYPEHPLYARAVYKLGWAYYRMDDFEHATEAFTKLLDHYVAAAAKTGEKAGGDVWPEAIQYLAISFADERWGGVPKARAYFEKLGGRSYEAEVYGRLGDVYFEETKWALAVEAYKALLEKEPLSPDAPKIQAKIVLCWSRDRQFDKEAAEREALVAAYAEGTRWWKANKGDPDLIAAVRDLSEKSLLRAASFHHAQAQQYKKDDRLEAAVAEYRVAAKVYGAYLARFPHSKQAHELAYNWADCLYNALDFEQAARIYARVRDDPASEKFLAEAARSAVISWQGEITRLQRAGKLEERRILLSKDRPEGVLPVVERIPPVYENLVRDSDAFLALVPGSEHAPTIAYEAGVVFYEYGDFPEARCRFEEVVARWPTAPVAQFAANYIIESHLAVKDWASVEMAAARLQSAEVAKNPELYATLQKFKLGGRFQRAMQLMDEKQYEDSAALFLALVAEDPKHEFADKALYNAASCYEGARRFESALKLYERIYAEYPSSVLADEALFRVGWNAENTYDFQKAVDRYLLLVEKYPDSKHRKDALYDAARSLENLQRYDEAAAAFARYAKAYPDADDAARTQFHAALMYEKTGGWKGEVQALQEFARRFARSREHELVVQAHLKIGLAYRELGQAKEARAAYGAAVQEFAARGLKPDAHPRAAAAAAEARFRLAEFDFERYDKIALPATTNTKKLKAALEAKLKEAKKVAPQYDEVMRYRRPDWILAAFYRKAYLLERLAQTLYDAPIPPEVKNDEEMLAAYQDALAQAASPYEDQAVKVYVDAIEAARKLHVKNEWTKKVGESLARYRPTEYPIIKEAKARMILEDTAPIALADTPEGPTRRALPGAAEEPARVAAPPRPEASAGGTSAPASPEANGAASPAAPASPEANGAASPAAPSSSEANGAGSAAAPSRSEANGAAAGAR